MTDTRDNATLTQPLPCPWCGHSGISISQGSTFRWRVAECNNCGACIGEERHNTMADDQLVEEICTGRRCLEAWNTRVLDARCVELLAAAKIFDALLQPLHDEHRDNHPIYGINSVTVTAGDFRRLRKAIAAFEASHEK